LNDEIVKISLIKTGHLGSNVIPRCVLFHPRRWWWTHLFVAYYATCATVAFCGILRNLCDSSLLSSTNLSRRRQPCPARSVICHNCWLTNDRFYCPRRSCDTGTVTYVGFEPVTNSIRYWSTNHIATGNYVISAIGFIWMMKSWRSHWSKLVTLARMWSQGVSYFIPEGGDEHTFLWHTRL